MNNSPYLDRPLLPLAVALPRMLQEIEAALAAADLAEVRRLRQRVSSANLSRQPDHLPRCDLERGRRLGSPFLAVAALPAGSRRNRLGD